MKVMILMLTSMLLLSGCQLTRLEGEINDVDVGISSHGGGHHSHGHGGFCPPGQAKKGNC